MVHTMDDHRTAIALVLGAIGFSFGLFIAYADARWLGVPAGVAALMTGFLAYRISLGSAILQTEVRRLTEESEQLQAAVADQIQARLAAEEGSDNPLDSPSSAETSLVQEGPDGPTPAAPSGAEAPQELSMSASDAPQSLSDPLTGLFNEAYFGVTVEARISSARRHLRPVAVVMVDVVEDAEDNTGQQADPVFIAEGITETLREADTACRMTDGRFALILEDTPENGAIWTIERLRRCLTDDREGLTVWAGIACYPAHAFDTTEIVAQAQRALDSAREWHQDRIEVAEAQ